mmetsp:Transcript_28094/g.47275  ORF Transcript_28094/g.47275 Transcript_28094/m.47275 type:complete len:250 (+) Transcript_28094:86-835(+)|eukprot:CAMPEP_0174968610 /NCGR_PEP_ID=MMETSP0004_2-20121128/8236_1 /TAXON_ID=420556 /ORGANISM="Ochromonas sp., Strain CCMP1393" /LENGTH=249 /DNA_ID=CAMNT_0016217875 /DNA_START=62 /DNA_END=811 /DNA_ORIENTATION=-
MKYLENLALENLTKLITNRELGGGLIIQGRCETYSTKKAGDDKKQSKMLDSKFESSTNKLSAVKPDVSMKTKKVLGDLIQTMNSSMVDYDFSELTPDSFAQITTVEAIQGINSYLAELTVSMPSFINDMWRDVNDAMGGNLSQCEVYKLVDSMAIDEVENGTVWSFNFFFCNKELKRVLYFTCMATSKYRRVDVLGLGQADDDDEEDTDDDNDDEDEDIRGDGADDAMDTSYGGNEQEESDDDNMETWV